MKIEILNIGDLNPAPYNPRAIANDEAKKRMTSGA